MKAERIHRWDKGAALRAIVIGATIEAATMAPAALSKGMLVDPWMWLSALLNVPGILVMHVLLRAGVPIASNAIAIPGVFIVQTIIISYFVFVYSRYKKLKA